MRLGSLTEGVRLSTDQLMANKFRSGITILGVVIGVATVMGMSAMVNGVRSSVMSGIEAAGPKNFILSRWNFDGVQVSGGQGGPSWRDNPPITVAEAELLGDLEHIAAAVVDIDLMANVSFGREYVEGVNVSANSTGWDRFTAGTMVAGHHFLPSDVRGSRRVVIISQALAETLMGARDPVGSTIRLDGVAFRVIGIFEVEGNIFAETDAFKHFMVVPYTTALKHLNAPRDFLSVAMVTADASTQDQAMDQTIATLRRVRGLRPAEPNNFAIIRQEEMLNTFNQVTGIFFLVMIGLSSVALMVGGVGVIAIMLISVTERTREIGIRKAIGATRSEILFQFLMEAVTLTVIGAALGLLIGGAGALLVQAATPIPATVPMSAIVAALGMAATAGIVFGLWPAWRASRMDPVEALRYE